MTFPPETLVQIQNDFTQLFLMMPTTKIAQMVPLQGTNGLPELYIRNDVKNIFILNHWSQFKIISQNCSYDALYQNLTNGYTPPIKWAARALSVKCL